jgi:hypothetical protein
MGANTYRALLEVVSSGTDANGSGMTDVPKVVVFSRSLQAPLTWANTTLVAEDVGGSLFRLGLVHVNPGAKALSPPCGRSGSKHKQGRP